MQSFVKFAFWRVAFTRSENKCDCCQWRSQRGATGANAPGGFWPGPLLPDCNHTTFILCCKKTRREADPQLSRKTRTLLICQKFLCQRTNPFEGPLRPRMGPLIVSGLTWALSDLEGTLSGRAWVRSRLTWALS